MSKKLRRKEDNSESKRINNGREKTKKICTDYMKAVSLLPWSSVRLPQCEPSLVAGWWMKCEAQSGCHLRHSFLMAVVVWNRRHCSRQMSQASYLKRCLKALHKIKQVRAFLGVHLKNTGLQSTGGNKKWVIYFKQFRCWGTQISWHLTDQHSSYVKYSLYPNVMSCVSRVLDVDNWLEVIKGKKVQDFCARNDQQTWCHFYFNFILTKVKEPGKDSGQVLQQLPGGRKGSNKKNKQTTTWTI